MRHDTDIFASLVGIFYGNATLGPNISQLDPNFLPDGTQMAPKGHPDGTRWLLNGIHIAPDATQMTPDGTQMVPRWHPDGTRWLPDAIQLGPT